VTSAEPPHSTLPPGETHDDELDGERVDRTLPTDATSPGSAPVRRHSAKRRAMHGIAEWAVVIVGALIVALVIRAFLFQAFYIPSESMEPTLVERDRVIVNKLSYRLHDVNRGDLVVFDRPPNEPPTEISELIKRVVGLPGETVEGRDGIIYIDGQRLVEPYIADGPSFGSFGPVDVPEHHVFVMGDNRNNSRDSRVFGPISEDLILGRAFVRVWPGSRLGFL
jgi:signal peptidase I